ncbi:MAG: TetR/AcrR family transcriptional regulator [Rhodospirillaceae bacterium]|jgi:AcrR family transcriptional regulator|nr:TetR/AcrR family transcriptional regulator [Rhodospirillaceae bacterium]MBT7956588.1 TetR/AcrR family transcriptional regulator [Rhodospirillaceae bacterium]
MAQVKKTSVRDAILESATELFTEQGYSNTTLADISRKASVTMSNIYNYYDSKLDVLFAIYEPWLDERIDFVAEETEKIKAPKERMRYLLKYLFSELPADTNCFANNFMQAIVTRKSDEIYTRDLLLRSEEKISEIIRNAIPDSFKEGLSDNIMTHFLFMAHDGFVINYALNGPSRRVDAIIDLLCNMIFNSEPVESSS